MLHFLILFLLGFGIFATLYAAVGAATNNVQEAQQYVGFLVIFLIIPMFLLIPIINDPDSTLAVVLSICSEADAFVAAGLTQFSMTSRLVFLVVGPMVDLKLVALQVAAFGPRFARVFAPLTFITAVVVGTIVGTVLL